MNSHTETKVLLIGRGLLQIDRMIETLNMVGAEVIFADDATEGIKLMCFGDPNLVVCHTALPDADAAELCKAVRANKRLSRTPFILAGDPNGGIDGVFNALCAGVDDFLTEHFSADHFLAKLIWMVQQRSGRDALRNRFEALRRSQTQTLAIVRQTADLFSSLAADDLSGSSLISSSDERIKIGLEMISGLANLVEEQINAADTWFETEIGPAPAMISDQRAFGRNAIESLLPA